MNVIDVQGGAPGVETPTQLPLAFAAAKKGPPGERLIVTDTAGGGEFSVIDAVGKLAVPHPEFELPAASSQYPHMRVAQSLSIYKPPPPDPA